jgi:coenzyme Q-binding protein COQ10
MKPLPLVRHCRRAVLSGYRLTPSRSLALAHHPPHSLQRLRRQQTQPSLDTNSKRPFHLPDLSSLLPSNNSNNNNNNNRKTSDNTVTATRTLPYPPEPLYKVISSVESYAQFLPFLTASTVTARDPQSGAPTRAFLTVGYGPLTETFTSDVRCDRSNWVVEAKSGTRFANSDNEAGAAEGVFKFLNTKWTLRPLEGANSGTRVDLEIALEFRSRVHAAMLGAVKGEMAGVMIEAFERRIREVGA